MRLLFTILFVTIGLTLVGQTPDEYKKIRVYLTNNGDMYSQKKVDSIWYFMNHFVSTTKIGETTDSVYYTIKHFEKLLVSDRYQQDGNYCDNKKRKTEKEIKNEFPYNSLNSIKVVSFKEIENDSVYIEPEIPKTNGQIDLNKMFEVKTLDKDLKRKMLDILVNYDNGDRGMEVAMCWWPRNGIIFLDKSDKVLGYIEICFECLQYKKEPQNLKLGSFCREKLDAIQGIMMKAGISYGMKVRGR